MANNPRAVDNLIPLKKWETANPNWRPRKLFRTVNEELKAKWIEQLSKDQLIEAYWLVFNTDEEELERIAKDKNYPFALRLIILELNNKNNRAKAMSDYRDYMFWKAKQIEEINLNWKLQIELTPEEKKQQEELLKLNN